MKTFLNKKFNTEPWNIISWNRIEILKNEDNKKKVVYIYEKADSSTFRYRVYNMCQALNYGTKWKGTYFFENEICLLDDYLDKIDVVVLVRVRWSIKIDNFISRIKKEKISIVFDTDDLVFDIEKIPLIMNSLNIDFENPDNYSYWFSYVSRLCLTGKKCDFFIGTNDFLAKKIENFFDKPVFIANNFLNDEQIDVSGELFLKKIKGSKKNKHFKIAYFSGTPSHINDFKEVSGELVKLMEKYPNIIVDVAGYMEFPDNMKEFAKNERVIHSPFVDFITLQKKISEADINIVPLVDNEFTNCKSELKFFEASIVGTVTCATPTYAYRENIKSGKNGFLCSNSDWYSCIEHIYKNKTNKTLIANANEYCLSKYSPRNQFEKLENILDKILNS